ncbi:MAG: hypothetical protein US76_01015 [Parcubacteria group bacterium GW2011_GWA2_38_13b]|nr:MAG: hypothetical protein US76_01015 [Parcubacteria group bacterium GW2011_GWA2_38_13b]
MWVIFAFLSAIFAAFATIFIKLGLKNVGSNFTPIIISIGAMSIIALVFITVINGFKRIVGYWNLTDKTTILYMILGGAVMMLSIIFYFTALKYGQANKVAVIDRLSLAFVAALAVFILGERISPLAGIGIVMMIGGALLVTMK